MFLKKIQPTVMLIAAMLASTQALATLEKNGIDESFWRETVAIFQIIPDEITNFKLEGTIFGMFVQETGIPVKELLEDDQNTLLLFSIIYAAPVKLKHDQPAAKNTLITQYGFYRTLHPKLQQSFKTFVSETPITIRYSIDNPIAIEFKNFQNFIPAPTMLTSTIDARWKFEGP